MRLLLANSGGPNFIPILSRNLAISPYVNVKDLSHYLVKPSFKYPQRVMDTSLCVAWNAPYFGVKILCTCKYLAFKIFAISESGSYTTSHPYFARILKAPKLWKPMPPSVFLLQSLDHFVQWIFLLPISATKIC